MTSTYSYTITNKNDNSIFLSGFFNVTNSLIIDFYDYSQNNKNIFINDKLNGQNNQFIINNNNYYFSFGGTNIDNSNTNVYNLISNYITSNNLTTSVSSYYLNLYFQSNNFLFEIYNNTSGAVLTKYSNYNISITPIFFSNPLCYNEDSNILTLINGKEEYREIRFLKKGDLIKIYPNSYKKIEYIGKNILKNSLSIDTMYICKKNSNNKLIRDLIVTGLHHIEYDETSNDEYKIILDGIALLPSCKSSLFTKIIDDNFYTYYHLVLESNENEDNHYVIWVNGILSESTNKYYFKKSLLIEK
jgi:hypothetical protein